MNSEGALDVLYKGFDDPKFSEDLFLLKKMQKNWMNFKDFKSRK